MLQILPVLAYAALLVVMLGIVFGLRTARWWGPAGVGVLFLAFSGVTVAREGVLQFWVNHTTTFAGNQVWFDLLIAVAISFFLLAPRARAVGMPLLPWALAVVATASVALLPMLARVLWLEAQARGR